MWERLIGIWSYPLITLSGGAAITVGQVVLVALLVTVGLVVTRWIERLAGTRLKAANMQADAVHAVQRVLFYTFVAVIIATALALLHVPLTAFAFVSGAVAIGVGFGAQNIINNFISSWILMSERPVRIGDFVEIEGSHGTIETIGNRSTRIRRVDGVHMLVPNSSILEKTVVNWTLMDKQIRSMVRVGVSYGSPVRKVEDLIYRAVQEQPEVKPEPAPKVIFDDFGDNALVFDAYFWCDVSGEREMRQIRSDIRFKLTELFEQNAITIAFPQRDVHLDGVRPLRVELIEAAKSDAGHDR